MNSIDTPSTMCVHSIVFLSCGDNNDNVLMRPLFTMLSHCLVFSNLSYLT